MAALGIAGEALALFQDEASGVTDEPVDGFGEFGNADLLWITDVDGVVFLRCEQLVNASDQIGDIAEAAGLFAIPINGEGFTVESLEDEVGYSAAIIDVHARAVGVEDAHDAGIDAVEAMVGHGEGFGKALGFVVDGALADGIDVAPVTFLLRMLERVAINFAGGGKHEARVVGEGETEAVVGAESASFHGLDRQIGIA